MVLPNNHCVTKLFTSSPPIGLLPKGITSFQLFDDGRFEAKLDALCTAKLESGVRYNDSVSGTISPSQIAGLSGIDAQDLFLWFPVLAIRLDNETDGIIHFDVGVVTKSYPVSLFDSPPDCWPECSVFRFGSRGEKGEFLMEFGVVCGVAGFTI